jgi:hypothetical protein
VYLYFKELLPGKRWLFIYACYGTAHHIVYFNTVWLGLNGSLGRSEAAGNASLAAAIELSVIL